MCHRGGMMTIVKSGGKAVKNLLTPGDPLTNRDRLACLFLILWVSECVGRKTINSFCAQSLYAFEDPLCSNVYLSLLCLGVYICLIDVCEWNGEGVNWMVFVLITDLMIILIWMCRASFFCSLSPTRSQCLWVDPPGVLPFLISCTHTQTRSVIFFTSLEEQVLSFTTLLLFHPCPLSPNFLQVSHLGITLLCYVCCILSHSASDYLLAAELSPLHHLWCSVVSRTQLSDTDWPQKLQCQMSISKLRPPL